MSTAMDIVERLRQGFPTAHENVILRDARMEEAADEIERLRAALEPFAAQVRIENGCAIYHGHADAIHYWRAYNLLRANEQNGDGK